MSIIVFTTLLLALPAAWFAWRTLKKRRRDALLATPLSPDHCKILRANVPIYKKLPEDLRARFEGLINLFLAEFKFYGQSGFEITDEVRVTIAAQAALPVLNKENRWYSSLKTIHVYPGAFKSKLTEHDGHLHTTRDQARSGESWSKGPVVLSWEHAAYGAFIDSDGQNVVLHEFAHQLDEQTGVTDGAPLLDKDQNASEWARVFQDAYGRLVEDVRAGRATFLDAYGATSPAEFFAVATEFFFEKPEHLREEEPALYEQLTQYFRLDPVSWV